MGKLFDVRLQFMKQRVCIHVLIGSIIETHEPASACRSAASGAAIIVPHARRLERGVSLRHEANSWTMPQDLLPRKASGSRLKFPRGDSDER